MRASASLPFLQPSRPLLQARQGGSVEVIPCSGIGKVHGLISREAVYHVTDNLLSGQADTVCLALLVTGDAETRQKVQQTPCVTLDGCPKLCAFKNVELSGGKIAKSIRVYDVMKRHRGASFGTATVLSEEGWAAVEELATEVGERRFAREHLTITVDGCSKLCAKRGTEQYSGQVSASLVVSDILGERAAACHRSARDADKAGEEAVWLVADRIAAEVDALLASGVQGEPSEAPATGGACCSCGSPSPDGKLEINVNPITINGLPLIRQYLQKKGLKPDNGCADTLLETVRIYHPIEPNEEAEYRNPLVAAYRTFCERGSKGYPLGARAARRLPRTGREAGQTGRGGHYRRLTRLLRLDDFAVQDIPGSLHRALAVGAVRNGGQELTLQAIQAALMCQEMVVVGDGRPTCHTGATVWNIRGTEPICECSGEPSEHK